ncbi:hypothetical protein POSPLADRAFT_1127029 [Postia placenta MAD-698-R-SB12]|uniref:HIT domain-containing protein n=1 Tax=Postia placenta MAD-698-R-SB12 TaxID=670580 RepID=A0A1X6NH07_9APHY|nr:hypothetical protein POSPLADRAFT_1127029 [Postia placenta MAD-698-R-SB12]OSX67790.1 hypothetical protein POSPLADRAFT_1127029 [Postia placenta MAD-698-R-SB12]
MAFAPKPGCPMCSIVASANHLSEDSAASPQIIWRDENLTAYRETASPVSSLGHIIIVFKQVVDSENLEDTPSDLPLLASLRDVSQRLLSAAPPHPTPSFRIGFITPPFRDIRIPVTDHLHAHAYILPADRMGWVRSVGFGSLAWYAIDDLMAEIREESSNNRVRSGPTSRPIDSVPSAGARVGTADGTETTKPSIATVDLEHVQ